MRRRAKLLGSIVLGAGLLALAVPVGAELPPEDVGQVMRLPERAGDHWLWVPDRLFRHSALFDGDSGLDRIRRSPSFFDVVDDPATEKGVRDRSLTSS